MAPPFKVIEFDIMYGKGISKVGEIIDLGVELDLIQKAGSWYSYNNEKIGQGRDAVKNFLLDNPGFAEELEVKIKDHFFGDVAENPSELTEDNAISKN
jgi:recombination protein RecA